MGGFMTINSSALKQPVDELLLFNSVCAAITGLAKTLATERTRLGATVNNVRASDARTGRLDSLTAAISARSGGKPEDVLANWKKQMPAGRVGIPEKFAAKVTFASQRARYVNGISLVADGGVIRSLL